MMELLTDPQAWLAFLTLSALEIVLGIDNIIFISVLVGRLPPEQRRKARNFGLLLAMGSRIALLLSIVWLIGLTRPWFTVLGNEISGRDLVLILGGLFLLGKSVLEIHHTLEGAAESKAVRVFSSFGLIIMQIAVIDIVFSLDSVFTAVGLADQVPIMVAAIIVAVLVMMLLAGPISDFVDQHPTVKVLALAFLILVGMALVADGLDTHVPKGYLYFAMAFSVAVEMINLRLRKALDRRSAGLGRNGWCRGWIPQGASLYSGPSPTFRARLVLHMKNARTGLLATALAALALAGCSKPGGEAGSDTGPIRIGEFASLTGKEATFGTSSHEGTLLAIEEINAAGGVLGRPLELVFEDNRSLQGESSTIAKKLISSDKVVALLGEVASGRSLEVAPLAQSNRIPMISPSSTNPDVTRVGDYVFRVCFTDTFQGGLLARFAKDTLKAKKVAIFSDVAAAYSVGLAQYFREPWLAGGGEIVSEQKYTGNDKDFKAQLTVIKNAGPDAIFVPGYYTDVGLIVAQARQLGITVPLFGGDGWEAPQLIQLAGAENLEGTYYSTHFSPGSADPAAQQFVEAYKARYNGKVPDAMAALGYDSARVLADAIRRAGTTEGPALRDALAATKDFRGATGLTTLDENRDAPKAAVIITVKDGKFEYVQSVER